MDREEKILSFMNSEGYVPMKAKDMAVVLDVPKDEYGVFIELLDKLVAEYKIQMNRKSKYRMVEEDQYLTGVFRGHERGFGFVTVEGKDEDIYISANRTKNAMSGDKVLIELVGADTIRPHSKDHRQEGNIVRIIKREKDTVVGLFIDNKNFGFVTPDDKKIGADIFIPKKEFGGAKTNTKVVVKITKYPEEGKNAEGKVIEVLGRINEAGVDVLSLIREYNLPYEFPESVLEEAKKIGEEIPQADLSSRLDLRNKEIFTIDGEDAKDLDDAICLEKTKEGTYLLRSAHSGR